MKRLAFYPIAVLLLILCGLLTSRPASAAAVASRILTITPATTKPTIDPGGQTRGTFQILNQGTGSYPVTISSAPYSVQGEDYNPDFTPVPGRPNPASWIHFDTAHATVSANKPLNVAYHIMVPADTQPGGYYAVAFAETQAPNKNQGVIVNERVGEIFYIHVAGPVVQSGKLLSWSSNLLQQPPLLATLRLENNGGIDYASNVHIVVSDLFGNPKYDLSTQKEVLPQTIRRIPISWSGAPFLGLFKVGGSATVFGKSQSLPTKYVLVISPVTRYVLLGIVCVAAAYGVARIAARRHASRRKKYGRP